MDSNSKNNVPNTVYHYTSPSGLLGIVDNEENSKNAKLWFTRWDSLNDKNERYDIQEVLKEYKKSKGDSIPKEFQDAIQKLIDTDVDEWELPQIRFMDNAGNTIISEIDSKNVYICSFSVDKDSLPMWNYYSKSSHYEGYALEINFERWKEHVEKLIGYALDIRRVIYRKDDKIAELDAIVLKCKKNLEIVQENPYGIRGTEDIKRDLSLSIAKLQFCFKDEHFSHENEVRVIFTILKNRNISNEKTAKDGDASNKVTIKYRQGYGYTIPYVEIPVPKEAITSVRVGPLFDKELAKKNVNVKEILESRGCSCKVHTSEVPIRY